MFGHCCFVTDCYVMTKIEGEEALMIAEGIGIADLDIQVDMIGEEGAQVRILFSFFSKEIHIHLEWVEYNRGLIIYFYENIRIHYDIEYFELFKKCSLGWWEMGHNLL